MTRDPLHYNFCNGALAGSPLLSTGIPYSNKISSVPVWANLPDGQSRVRSGFRQPFWRIGLCLPQGKNQPVTVHTV